jgi:hypothetical protein
MRRPEHAAIRGGAEHLQRVDVPVVVIGMSPLVLVDADVDEVLAG